MSESEREEIERLRKRVLELEQEVQERERDLSVYREELSRANLHLERLLIKLNNELNLASQVQRVLIPTELPHISGFEFSSKFLPGMSSGGDYFDIFEHEDRFRFGILVASSSGYGLSALLLSLLLRLSGQLSAKRGMSPSELLSEVDKELRPRMQSSDTIDIFYGLIDRRNFEMTYSRAGMITALHQSFSSGQLGFLEGQQPALSPDHAFKPETSKILLNPRDRLVFCTAGLMKIQNQKGEFFGQERVYKAILEAPQQGVHDTRNEILFQMDKFSQSSEIQRDVTVVVTEVKDRVIKLAKSDLKTD